MEEKNMTPINFGNLPDLPEACTVYQLSNGKYQGISCYISTPVFCDRFKARKELIRLHTVHLKQLDNRFRAIYVPILMMEIVLFIMSDAHHALGLKFNAKRLHGILKKGIETYNVTARKDFSAYTDQIDFMAEKFSDQIWGSVKHFRETVRSVLMRVDMTDIVMVTDLQVCYTLMKIIKDHNRICGMREDEAINKLIYACNELSEELVKGCKDWDTVDLNTVEVKDAVNDVIARLKSFDVRGVIKAWQETKINSKCLVGNGE